MMMITEPAIVLVISVASVIGNPIAIAPAIAIITSTASICQRYVQTLPNIYQPSTKHRPNIYQTSTHQLPTIYQTTSIADVRGKQFTWGDRSLISTRFQQVLPAGSPARPGIRFWPLQHWQRRGGRVSLGKKGKCLERDACM